MKALVISVATMVVLLSPSFAADDLPEPPMWPHETASSSGTRIQFGVEGGYNDTTVNGDSGDAVTLKR